MEIELATIFGAPRQCDRAGFDSDGRQSVPAAGIEKYFLFSLRLVYSYDNERL